MIKESVIVKRYQGLIAAVFSPFDSSGDLNLRVIEPYADLLAGAQVTAIFPCGSTGESHSLTVAERKTLAARWKVAAKGRFDVLVHVGHNCQRDAADLAAHAQEIGADGVAALAPSYFRPGTPEDLVDFLAPVAAACPRLPFYYYDIPSMTGVVLPTDQVLAIAGRRIPNLAGLKYTSTDLMTLQSCIAYEGGKYDILFGSDEILLATLPFGVRGAIGSTYNYAAPVYHRVLKAFAAGDMDSARRHQLQSVEVVKVLMKFGGLRTGKALMSMVGIDCGPVRSPLRPLTMEQLGQIYEMARPLDVFINPLKLG